MTNRGAPTRPSTSDASGVLAPLLDRPVGQIGIVVRDLEAAARHFSATLSAGPWRLYSYPGQTPPRGADAERTFRGRRSRFTVRIALNQQEPMIELLQPVRGPSTYHEWLERHGEGLHHLGFWVDSLDETISVMRRRGFEVLQSGRGLGVHGDGGFAYFDTGGTHGVILEAIELPSQPLEPEAIIL